MDIHRTRVLAAAGTLFVLLSLAIFFLGGSADDMFMPHAHCYLFNRSLMWLHGGSDMLIGLSYVAISATLTWMVFSVRKELPFHSMMLAFALFIVACGATHFFEVWTLQSPHPQYWLAGGVKGLTALASVVTAIFLPPLVPKVKSLLQNARLSGEHKAKLETAYAELERLYEKVTRLDELKTSFFANVSHELRTPLTLISSPLDRLMKTETSTEALRDLRMMRRNTMLLHKYVNDLLDISKIEANAMDLNYSRVNLAVMARFMESVFDSMMADHRVTLDIAAPEELVVTVDGDKVQRVILNLLSNALNHTPPGGRICLGLCREGDQAEIRVDDSGPGIAAEYRDKIFERFQMGDPDTRKRFGGSGLGLSIVKEFVTRHRGTVNVTDSPLGGASFVVRLPVQAPGGETILSSEWESTHEMYSRSAMPLDVPGQDSGEAALPEEAEQRMPGVKEPVLLLVEDNWDMSDFISRVLRREGRIITASNGREALDIMHRERPDLVVTDVMMPVMTGEELVAEIRKDAVLQDIPVLVLTARPADENQAAMLLKGVQDYVTKPFLVEELRARVHNLLAAKLTRDSLRQEVDSQSDDVRQLARELAQRARELDQANRAKDHFLAVLSHELRTPLTPTLAAARLMETADSFEPSQVRETMAMIRRNIELEARLVDDLLDYTGIAKGKLQLELVPLDLHQTVRHAAAMCEAAIRNKKLSVEMDLAAASHVILGDEARLSQVVWNILLNSVKFTPSSGRLLLKTSNPSRDRVKLEVIDTGMGIEPDILPHIFEPFRQGSPERGRHLGGLGLGLSVAKGLVEAHGGSIRASSVGSGRGTTMTLEFAVTPAAVQPKAAAPPPAAAPARTFNILLVEDHEDTRIVLAQMLKKWGHKVTTAGTVAEGLSRAREIDGFDLLVSDVGLPDGTGMDLLRGLGTQRPPHAIAVSGYGMVGDLEQSRAAGFSQHLTKPVTAERLKEALGHLAAKTATS